METTSSPKKKPLGLSKEKHDELQQLIKQVTMSTQQRAAKATMPMTPDDSDGEQPTNHTPSDIISSDIQAITSTSGSENQATTSSSDNVTGELNYTSESDRNAPLSTINKSDIELSDILGHHHVQLHVDISEIEAILAMENDLKPEDISMDQEEDDGHISDATTLPYEFDQEIQDAISIGTSLTCPENKTMIIDEYGISVEVCEAGILHIKTNPTVPKCTGNNDCKIQLHQAEGLLCKAHNVPLSKYRESIEFALMQRITRNKDGALQRMTYSAQAAGLGIRSFQKNVPFFPFFSVLFKRTERSFRSFPFFSKERNVLSVLFRSLQKNVPFLPFFSVPLKRTERSFYVLFLTSALSRTALSQEIKLYLQLYCSKKERNVLPFFLQKNETFLPFFSVLCKRT